MINRAIYSFHMPLFFILSGLVTHTKSGSLGSYVKKQFFRLLLPVLIFLIMSIPLYLWRLDSWISLEIIKRITFWDGQVPYNDPLWFFIVLFELKMVDRLLDISRKNKKAKVMFCILCFAVGFIVYHFAIFLPFGLNRCILGLGFYSFGCVVKGYVLSDKKQTLAITILLFLVWILSGVVFNTNVSMYVFKLGYYWFFVMSGITGSLLFIEVCKWIDLKTSYFRTWGVNTIFIISTHYVFCSVFHAVARKIGLTGTWMYTFLLFIYAVVILLMYQPVCNFVNKKLPLLNGKYGRKI